MSRWLLLMGASQACRLVSPLFEGPPLLAVAQCLLAVAGLLAIAKWDVRFTRVS